MANAENLKLNSERTPSERQELAQKAGQASGRKRRERKALREELLLLLSKGQMQKKISLALLDKALKGDVKAFEVIRDTIGEKPIDKQLNVEGTKEDLEIVIDKKVYRQKSKRRDN